MRTYTIGEVAGRSGFSASALRYYEGIGLVAPAARTPAGYRVYDDDTLSRLTFIARAKQLGCRLDEIADLVGLWEGERCGPVQRRFHDLVTTKLDETRRQIDELTALADQLRQAAVQLAGSATDGPCDDGCACLGPGGTTPTAPARTRRGAPRTAIPIHDATAPIACTADGGELAERLLQLERMRVRLQRIERTEHGVVLRFPDRPEIDAELQRFVVDEKACCGFWGFRITSLDDELVLRWDAPPTLDGFMDRLVALFQGHEPITAASGLL